MTRAARVLFVIAALTSWSDPARSEDLAAQVCAQLAVRPSLLAFYRGDCQPVWIDHAGRTRPAGDEAMRLLRSAAADGLDPSDYAVSPLNGPVAFELDLSEAVLQYARDLHMGRVDPRSIGFQLNVPRDGHDFESWVRDAATANALPALAETLRPRDAQYGALAAALARYRRLAADVPQGTLARATRVRAGEPYADVSGLWARLVLLGDAPSGDPPVGELYAGAVVEAVKAFQRRHGLDVDGTLGPRTFDALAVPLPWRVRQLELAMERLRWLPHAADGRLLVVNIPMFRVWAWDRVPTQGAPSFTTGVIVGRALGTQTPVFSASLTEIIFQPYWNVPRSIVVKEILPAVRKDPLYLQKHDMEVVVGQGDRVPVLGSGPDVVERLRRGEARLRQRPGATNSLGRIKFSFPNENDVYMHDTPARALFSRSRRDFSHGCVRVEDPVGLAEWVFADPRWSRDAIAASMDAATPSRVTVARPVRVLIFYNTAAADPATGAALFAEDIYRHDPRLDAALRARSPAPDASRVDVDEVRTGIVADAAPPD